MFFRHFVHFHLLSLLRQRSLIWQGWAFIALVMLCLPLTMQAETAQLQQVGAAALWLGLLLAAVLAAHSFFDDDHRDGTLTLLALTPASLPTLVAARLLGHWAVHFLPVACVAPVLWGGLGLEVASPLALILAVGLVAWMMVALTALGAALTLGLQQRGGLLYVLLLPLLVPVLIFGGMVQHASPLQAVLALLGMAMVITPVSIWGAAAALKLAEQRL
jgi:heme exporter protein B